MCVCVCVCVLHVSHSIPFTGALESEFENVTSGSVELCTVSNTVPENGEVRLTGFGQCQYR